VARRSDNGQGLLIDRWHWKYKGVESELAAHARGEADIAGEPLKEAPDEPPKLVKDQVLEIEVRMLKNFEDGQLPRALNSTEFRVSCKAMDITVVGTDLELLRRAVWAKLEKEFEIEWEEWYLVQIASAQSFKGDFEVGFALSQNTIYRGVAHDGSLLMREYDRGRTFGPWRYKAWPGEYQDKGGHVIACIPATKENRKALDEFRARILELQSRLSELVKPEVILSTLANLAQAGLPAPSAASRDAIGRRSDD
jgi:hypothetical protein